MTQILFPKEFILFDTEFTAWEGSQERGWSGPNEYREVLQIGAIRVEAGTLAEKDFLDVLVRPVKNPVLSEFIIELTGITQVAMNERGTTLAEALVLFAAFARDLPIYSYGMDGEVLEQNCKLLGISFPFTNTQFINLRPLVYPLLEERGIDWKNYSSGSLIGAFGKDIPRRPHHALNDMRNMLDVLRELS